MSQQILSQHLQKINLSHGNYHTTVRQLIMRAIIPFKRLNSHIPTAGQDSMSVCGTNRHTFLEINTKSSTFNPSTTKWQTAHSFAAKTVIFRAFFLLPGIGQFTYLLEDVMPAWFSVFSRINCVQGRPIYVLLSEMKTPKKSNITWL